ncbi:MAG: hypothetical protein MJ158_00905 [Alphaproteobacteria bacterium]|nr:hypothetical protein [Alphaproteobacteria bacterium]
MKRNIFLTSLIALFPAVCLSAGTYYNGNLYTSPQQRASANRANNRSMGESFSSRYGHRNNIVKQNVTTMKKAETKPAEIKKQGLSIGVDFNHQFANWKFDMNQSGSTLHYDNVNWNVFSANGVYYFGDSIPMQINVGGSYGTQSDETTMIDDDISSGGYWIQDWYADANGTILGTQRGHALSVGTSKDGKQYGFNVGIGLTDFWKYGKLRITPSVGYRYFKYELKTQQNYGVAIDTLDLNSGVVPGAVTCITTDDGELQCDPIMLNVAGGGYDIGYRVWAETETGELVLSYVKFDEAVEEIDTAGTYYYEQSQTSHSYEVEWAGPYVALDMDYLINNNNTVSAGIEFGLPKYTATGDQPYRIDWAHPKSVEDEGGFGDAIHFGLNANWKTALTDSLSLNVGFTYDYYSVSGADATTYYNASLYENTYITDWNEYNSLSDEDRLSEYGLMLADEINALDKLRSAGWSSKTSDEIKSIYKSMGIHIGLTAKF